MSRRIGKQIGEQQIAKQQIAKQQIAKQQIAKQTVQGPMVWAVQALHAVAVVAFVVGSADVCVGATYTWTGATSNNWFDFDTTLAGGNWEPNDGINLNSNDSLVFDDTGVSLFPKQNSHAQITNLTFSGVGSYELDSDTSSVLTISGVLLQNSSQLQVINNEVRFTGGSSVVNTQSGTLTLGNLAGFGNFTKQGASTLNLTSASGYLGTMTVTDGSVNVASPFGGIIAVQGGTASFSSALKVDQTGGTIVFSTGTVTQSSTLDGVNSFTGTVGSTMTFNSSLLLDNSNRTTFRLADSGGVAVADEYVVNAGTLTYGGSMTLNFTNSGSMAIGTTWSVFDPNGGTAGDFAGIGGTGVGPYASLTWTTATSSPNVFDQRYGDGIWLSTWTSSGTNSQRLVFNQYTGDITVVPEPSTFVMAAAGIAGWGLMRYRRRSRATAVADAAKAA